MYTLGMLKVYFKYCWVAGVVCGDSRQTHMLMHV